MKTLLIILTFLSSTILWAREARVIGLVAERLELKNEIKRKSVNLEPEKKDMTCKMH